MFSWRRSTLVLGITLGGGSPYYAGAQAVHRWNSDVTVGGAIVEGGEFVNVGKAAAHLSVAGQLLRRERFAMYAEAGYDWLGRYGLLGADSDLTCLLDRASGDCEPPYPDVKGPSASIGLLYAPSTRVETRVGVGGAAYSVDGTRVGTAVGQLDAAVFPADHVGFILGARLAVIPRFRHDRLTMIPVLLGLRVR